MLGFIAGLLAHQSLLIWFAGDQRDFLHSSGGRRVAPFKGGARSPQTELWMTKPPPDPHKELRDCLFRRAAEERPVRRHGIWFMHEELYEC